MIYYVCILLVRLFIHYIIKKIQISHFGIFKIYITILKSAFFHSTPAISQDWPVHLLSFQPKR